MAIPHPAIIALVAALALSGPLPSHAQSYESELGQDTDEPDGGPDTVAPTSPTATPATTASVVALLASGTQYCKLLRPKAFVIDCLAERLGEVQKQLKGQEGFEDVRAVLASASRKLNGIARQNRSATLAPARFSTKGLAPVVTSRRLIPVDDARLDGAISQALAVIGEAETMLLRSAEASADRALRFQRIAAAMGTNKILLRSL